MQELQDPKADAQLRGLILTMVYINHKRQRRRLTSTVIHGTIAREGYRFTKNDVLTAIQDLRDRDYLRYQQVLDADQSVFIQAIELTAQGRDLVDRRFDDPAVMTQ
jgi:hypothetical protein